MFFSLNTCKFGDFVDLIELEIKYTTYTARSASYLDLHSESDNEDRIRTKLYDIRDDFNFPNVNIFIYMQQHSSSTQISIIQCISLT
jgi:glycosylphosphatidylinositol transamidase (GPIT) subunit GPI8